MKKRENFPTKKLGDFFRGVVYRGTCVGGMLGNKRQDRGEKISGGQKFGGGELLGEMQKKGWKNFLGGVLGEL